VSHATKKVENHWIKYSSSLYLFFYDFSSNWYIRAKIEKFEFVQDTNS
jgi:hypothetical protein